MPNTLMLRELSRVVRHHIAHDTPLHMGAWARELPAQEGHECGTVFCVAGHAACDPFFRSKGLEVALGGVHGQLRLRQFTNNVPSYLTGFAAIEHLFELDELQSAYIFGDNPWYSGMETASGWHEVLNRIEEVMRGEI